MTYKVQVKKQGEWRTATPLWENLPKQKAEEIAETYHKKHGKPYKAKPA